MIDYIATLLAYIFDLDKKNHPARGKEALLERIGKEEENHG